MKCAAGLEVKVLKSNAGYYIGTLTKEGYPNCRLSDYAVNKELALELPLSRINAPENIYCQQMHGKEHEEFYECDQLTEPEE